MENDLIAALTRESPVQGWAYEYRASCTIVSAPGLMSPHDNESWLEGAR